jgi:hypothetical protein
VSDKAYRYVQLINSLPDHGPLFRATVTPLSRINLRQRLTLLEPPDAHTLSQVADLLDWNRHGIERSDADIVESARAVLPSLGSEFVRDLVEWRLQLRSLIAALRRRRNGEEVPGPKVPWGYGRWLPSIRRHWHEPHFGLERVFPWLPEAREYVDNGNALALERLLLATTWTYLERLSEGHEFDFEAVLIYVMRWDLVARWICYQKKRGTERFDEMVEDALEGFDLDAMVA